MLRNSLRLLALLLAGAAGTQMYAQQKSGSPLIQAQSALDANESQQAINILSSYLKTRPADDSAHLLLAEAYAMRGHSNLAEEQYQAVLKHAPDNYLALAGLGELYASAGKIDKAEPLLARAVKNSKREPQLRIEWAQALARLHRFKEASTALSSVLAPTSPKERIAFFRLKAAISAGLENSTAAASHMESALATAPDDAGLQLATAAAQLQAGNPGRSAALSDRLFANTRAPDAGIILLRAQIALRADTHATLASLRSLQLSPERELVFRQHLAQVLISQNRFDDAATDLARAAELSPRNPDLWFNLALARFKSGATKDALSSALKAKELRDGAEVESLLGDIQESLGHNLAAVKNYQAAAALDPNNEDYQLALALDFIRHRNFEPAKLVLQEAKKSFPTSWRIQVALGMIEYFVGTKAAASQMLLHAADLAADPALALRYLGEIELDESAAPNAPAVTRLCSYADAHPEAAREQLYCGALLLHSDYASGEKSRVDEIIRRLSTAAKALPNESGPHCELGRAYAWLENWAPAQEHAETCARLNPNSAQAHYRLSQIYRSTGQIDRAREEIRLYKEASQRLAQENEQHEKTLQTFLYTIQNQTAGTK